MSAGYCRPSRASGSISRVDSAAMDECRAAARGNSRDRSAPPIQSATRACGAGIGAAPPRRTGRRHAADRHREEESDGAEARADTRAGRDANGRGRGKASAKACQATQVPAPPGRTPPLGQAPRKDGNEHGRHTENPGTSAPRDASRASATPEPRAGNRKRRKMTRRTPTAKPIKLQGSAYADRRDERQTRQGAQGTGS